MRFSSSALRSVGLLLASTLCAELALPGAAAAAEGPPEPCLVLRFAGPGVSDVAARRWTDELPGKLAEVLRVRWVAHPELSRPAAPGAQGRPGADPGEIARIAARHERARALLERLETAEAARLLDAAAADAAGLASTDEGAALLGAVLVTRAVLLAGEGDGAGAEGALARARALLPGFAPDPATYSPRFLEAWAAAGRRAPAPARLVVTSEPPGADIAVDGRAAGTTPATVPVRHDAAVRLRVARPGFVPAERAVRATPGETVSVAVPLARDRAAELAGALESAPGGEETARLLSSALDEAGASLGAVLVVREDGGKPALDVFALRRGGGNVRLLGRIGWDAGEEIPPDAALRAGRMLAGAGWPPSAEFARKRERPWYYTWWFWGLVGVAVTGAAVAVSGGGSGGGSGGSGSTGSVDVTF